MEDTKKTKAKLINELEKLRKRIKVLEAPEKEQKLQEYEYYWGNKNYSEMTFLSTIQDIINVLPYFVMIIDEDHNILLANDAIVTAVGKNIENIVGCYCPKLIHDLDEPFPGCPLEDAFEKGYSIEKELLDPFYEKWVSSGVYPMKYKTQDGKKIFLHIARDITDRKKAEEMIQYQNEYLKNILESLTQPFYVIDANDYTIKMANSAANFGNLTENSKCYILTHKKNKPCNSKEHPCPIEVIKKTQKPFIVEHIHYTGDGNTRLFEVHGYPIFNKDGNITQIIEYTLDITERKRTEEKLKKTQKDLEIKSNNLEENNIALKVLLNHQDEEKKNTERNILANIKTLVSPYIEKLKYTSLNETQKTLLNILETNLSEMLKPFTEQLMNEAVNLSPTEVQVASLGKEGKTSKEIAEIMIISENTVKTHKRHIRSKLGIKGKKVNLRTYMRSLFKE